ncbi:MAG: NUDIX hydrolase [Dehalococcoidia bacterium]
MTDYIARSRERLVKHQPGSLQLGDRVGAAVLILLYPTPAGDCLLLTVRSELVEHHKGEISFPGGGVHEEDEDLAATALRETSEEVGVDPDVVEILGRLDDLLTISNFHVTPFVGVLHRSPYDFIPSPIEVAEVLEVPIAHLLDAANSEPRQGQVPGSDHDCIDYLFRGHRVWGATARILRQYLDLIRE